MDKAVSSTSVKKQTEWSKSVTNGDLTDSIRVEKLTGPGYLVTTSRYGYDRSDKKKEKYISKTEKYYSEKNPLEEEKDIDLFKELGKFLVGEQHD